MRLPHASAEFGSESGYFLIRSPDPMNDVAKSCPVSYRTINQYGGTTCEPCFSIENLDTIRCVWTREFDLNTLPLHGEMFESGRKKILDSKISWYVWTGPKFCVVWGTRRTTANFSYFYLDLNAVIPCLAELIFRAISEMNRSRQVAGKI